MAYVTLDDFARYVGSEIVADQAYLESCLAAAEEAVNDHCARSFDPVAAVASTRRYVPERDGTVVYVHDIGTTTDLVVTDDGSTVTAVDYQLEPVTVAWSGRAEPYSTIRRLSGYWHCDGGEATVAVTARWGWASVPEAVQQATMILAKDLVHVRDNRFGVAAFGDYGVIRARDNPHVTQLLARLRHPMAFGIA